MAYQVPGFIVFLFLGFNFFHFIHGMKESTIYTPSKILSGDLSKNDLDFLACLYGLSKNKEESISIDRIDHTNSVVEKFFEPYVKEFKDHEYCFRTCEGENELTKESQHFECIPAGQYVLDEGKGNVENISRYKIIVFNQENQIFVCNSLEPKVQSINFVQQREQLQGSFTVLKYDPCTFNHKNCKKNPCLNQNALCRQIDQGSSLRFIIE